MNKCPHCTYPTVFISSRELIIRCTNCGKDVEKSSLSSINSLKKGKLIICTIHGRTTMEGVDEQLLAVGKPKGTTYFKWWKHVPALAPSRELVTFTKEHNRKGHLEGWFERYVESLMDEWLTREDSIQALSGLVKSLNSGKVIAVSCYCDTAKREQCHLGVLRDLIQDLGFEVEEAEPIDYR